jgi:hypothetical protein
MSDFKKWVDAHGLKENAFEWYPKSSMYGIAQEAYKSGMLAAAEIAEVGSSLLPQELTRHSIRLRIANRIRSKADGI